MVRIVRGRLSNVWKCGSFFSKEQSENGNKKIRKNRKDSDGFSIVHCLCVLYNKKRRVSKLFLMQEGRMRSVEKMKYAEMAYVKNPVSRIFFGTATSSALEGSAGSELLDFVYGSGITAFDTARVYGQSEMLLGKWIEEKNMREKIVILSKCGHPDLKTWEKRVNEKAMWEDLETSLKELRTDFLIFICSTEMIRMWRPVRSWKSSTECTRREKSVHSEVPTGLMSGSNRQMNTHTSIT